MIKPIKAAELDDALPVASHRRYAERTREYTEHFRDGMRAALNLTRAQANVYANALPVREGDAFLAGYYSELRRLDY